MNRITTHLWFDKEAREAAGVYTSTFAAEDSKIKSTTTLHDTPSGTADIVTIDLFGQEFTLLSAGPLFTFTPAVSFLVACPKKTEVDAFRERLSENGRALMELGEYPFSERYGWVQDRYGLSWQIVPTEMDEMLNDDDGEKIARVTEAFLRMKKFDIAALRRAYEGVESNAEQPPRR